MMTGGQTYCCDMSAVAFSSNVLHSAPHILLLLFVVIVREGNIQTNNPDEIVKSIYVSYSRLDTISEYDDNKNNIYIEVYIIIDFRRGLIGAAGRRLYRDIRVFGRPF